MKSDRYVELLESVRAHLSTYGVTRWPPRLEEWIREFESVRDDRAARIAHFERTGKALVGMGSIADVVIRPGGGPLIPDDDRVVKKANKTLLELVEQLYQEVQSLLRKDRLT